MQKTIVQITDHLVSLVTSDKAYYTPKELLRAGIPSFIVERVRMHLEDRVREEIGSLESDWFDTDSKLVHEAWDDYRRTAVSSSHIPKESLYVTLNNVVKDIVHVFLEPRKNMAEYVFRDDDELTFDELSLRCSRLTIYKHFGTAIPLYMKKRELESLTKERCKLLIEKLDTKLVASYTAQDWAQKLEQLFILFGGKIDPKLLAIFFKDKGLENIARKFQNRSKQLTKTDFIYVISTEDLEGFASEQTTSKDEVKKAAGDQKKKGKGDQENSLIESFFGDYTGEELNDDQSLADQFLEGTLSDDEMNELLADIASDGVIEVDHSDQVDSLNELFSMGQSEDEISNSDVSETSEQLAEQIKLSKDKDDEEGIKEFRENLVSILDQAKSSYQGMSKDEEEPEDDSLASVFEEAESVLEDDDSEGIYVEEELNIADSENEESESEDDDPMWSNFLQPDQIDVIMGGERSKARKENPKEQDEEVIEVEDELSIEDDPVVEEAEETIEQPAATFENMEKEIFEILEDRKDDFIEIIFSGSKSNYKKAVKKIGKFESWSETSDYVKKEIFKKNDVDLLSGATVDFTDRLHRYFNASANA